MTKILVTATNYSKYCPEGKQLLQEFGCEIIENPYQHPYPREELKELLKDVQGVVAGIDTWNEELFKLSPNLKGIARFGVGVDNIDLPKAREYGITVSNARGINTSAVAEQALGLILSMTRQIPYLNDSLHHGNWTRPMVHELKSRIIGFLGFGAIACNLAEKLKPFGCTMIAYDKFPDQKKAEHYHTLMVSLEEVLKQSDIISIHIPATDETEGLICGEAIKLMKTGVYLVNTARGSIVREADVYEGMKSGKIAGYGTDVYEKGTLPDENPLFEFSGYIATPYTSAETYENYAETGIVTAKALIAVLSGREPENKLV